MENLYSRLLGPLTHCAAEKNEGYYSLSERHVQVMWLEQKYFRNLLTTRNENIQVLSPGIWNNGPGPDFLKAHLEINGTFYRGDIEVHLTEDAWNEHGHQDNPQYENVILHLVLWKPKQPSPAVVKSGRTIITAYLEPLLTIPLSRIASLIDLDLYPYEQFAGSGKCAKNIYQKITKSQTEDLFKKAALWRLYNKKTYLQQYFPAYSDCLLGGIALALGYKNNSQAFLDLFLKLKQHSSETPDAMLSLAMGWSGFFSDTYQAKWKSSAHYRYLHTRYQEMNRPDENTITLKLSQIRPLNHPIRRFVYLIHLVLDHTSSMIYEKMENFWLERYAHNPNWKKIKEHLCELLPSYKDLYWNSHYLFEPRERKEFLSLAGDNFREEVLINAFLPLLYSQLELKGDFYAFNQFHEFFCSFTTQEMGKTKYLQHRFFGNEGESFFQKAQYTQGAYQIHKDFCLHFEASCEGCPFIERYQKTFGIMPC